MPANLLTRKSTGLTPAHRELIKMLAQIAVVQYLTEVETDPKFTNEATHQDEESAR